MSDVTARLLAALEALERDPNLRECGKWCEGDNHSRDCDKRYDVRRRLAIAQRIAASWDAAKRGLLYGEIPGTYEAHVLAVFASPGWDT